MIKMPKGSPNAVDGTIIAQYVPSSPKLSSV